RGRERARGRWAEMAGKFGAVEKTRTSTPVKEQRPQRCASTNSATTALPWHRVRGFLAAKAAVVKGKSAASAFGRSFGTKGCQSRSAGERAAGGNGPRMPA